MVVVHCSQTPRSHHSSIALHTTLSCWNLVRPFVHRCRLALLGARWRSLKHTSQFYYVYYCSTYLLAIIINDHLKLFLFIVSNWVDIRFILSCKYWTHVSFVNMLYLLIFLLYFKLIWWWFFILTIAWCCQVYFFFFFYFACVFHFNMHDFSSCLPCVGVFPSGSVSSHTYFDVARCSKVIISYEDYSSHV